MKKNLKDIERALAEQASEYLQELDSQVDEIEQDVLHLTDPGEAGESLLRISRNAHSIKGSAGSYGFDLISTICHSLEDRVSGIRADNESLALQIDGLLRYLDLIRTAGRAYGQNDQTTIETLRRALGVEHAHAPDAPSVSQPDHQSTASATLKRKRVLLVEKMGPMMKLASSALNSFDPSGMEIAIAANGYEAFGRLLREPFDCVVMSNVTDLVNGVELIKLLENCRHPNSATPFVLFTSDHRLKAPEGGRRTFIVMKGADLRERLTEICGHVFGSRTETKSAFTVHDILLVDDSLPIQRLVQMVLKNTLQLEVRVAGTGADALAQIAARRPDIVLLDYQLPDTDGAALAQKIKALYPDQRFLFLTGADSEEEQARLLATGPVGIIKKPFPPMNLVQRLKEHARFAKSA